ncbi:MAG: uracil-xanthine permease family protein [Pseudomonadota bacterium]
MSTARDTPPAIAEARAGPPIANEDPSNLSVAASDLIYRLDDRPDALRSLLAALQHLMASVFAIAIVPLLIARGLQLDDTESAYLVSMALMVSGVATFIQSRRIGPVGSGLLCLQGTSFTFVATIVAGGLAMRAAGSSDEAMLAAIFGTCLAGCLVEIGLSQIVPLIRRIITRTVTGVVVTVIGLSLIEVGFRSLAGGSGAADFGSLTNLAIGGITMAIIIAAFIQRRPLVRISAILIGILIGSSLAALTGLLDLSSLAGQPAVTMPTPLKYGIGFSAELFVPIAILYLVTAIEAAGDLTATSVIAGEPVAGPTYLKRIRGGILGDGVNSAIAAIFNSFPSTTFGQNNGVIQLTGIASRHIALFIAPILVLLGLFPFVAALFVAIPQPVIGGAMVVLFGSIAVAGIRLLSSEPFTRKRVLVSAVSLGLGLGSALVPDAFQELPAIVRSVTGSPIALSGLTAILLTLILPEPAAVADKPANEADQASP